MIPRTTYKNGVKNAQETMNIRSKLEDAWKETVAADYLTGAIAYESDLRASIDRALRIKCPDASVFLEARMLPGESRIDLVLCEDSVVRLIAEIKFVPQGYPEWERDIQKLNEIAQLDSCEGHKFKIEPANGQFSGEKHYVNPDTRYAFIAVGRDDADAVDLKSIETELGALVLPLFSLCFGRIRPGKDPYFDSARPASQE